MKNFINSMANYFTPDKLNSESRKNSVLLIYFTLGGAITDIIYSCYVMFIVGNSEMATRMLIVGSFCICPLIIYAITKSFVIAANVLVFIYFAVIVSMIMMIQQYPGHLFFWFQLPILVSGFLVGKKWVIFWGTICITFTFVYYFDGGTFGPSIGTSKTLIDSLHVISSIGISVASLIFVYLYASTIDKNVNRLMTKNEQNRNLLQLVAHDVINPLMIIYTTVKLIKKHDEQIGEKEKRAWEKIDRASEIMKNILDQVRKMHAVRSGKIQLKLEPVSVGQSVKNSNFIFAETLKSKNIEFIYEESDQNIHVLADIVTFGNQVISNLLSNAIKFSNKGGKIIICVKNESNDMVHLQFKDNGIGMPENIINTIFDFNQHTSRLGTNGESGTGFGMPLAKIYIEKYGGTILVTSKTIEDFPNNHGTTFDIRLKRA